MSIKSQNVEVQENIQETVRETDISSQTTVKPKSESESPSSSQTTTTSTATVATANSAPLKRQRTLMEMVSVSSSINKKPRLDGKSLTTGHNGGANQTAKIVSSGVQPLNSIPFSLSNFQESLSEEVRPLLQLECETMGKSWLKVLKDEIRKPYFIELKKFLWKEGVKGPNDSLPTSKVYPSPKNIYAWSNTPLGRVRVVIIGQDPYHNPGQAHGLCFSVPRGVAIPPSLKNIYAELQSEYTGFTPPKHGNLSAWAESGVLLLNTALTVRANQAGSHSNKGWEQFTDKVVDLVDRYGGANISSGTSGATGVGRGIVFLAWGAWAAKRVAKLDKKKHLILTSAHPSPLSASRGFLGNGHFKKANDWLEAKYGKDGTVDWCKLD